MTSNQISTLRVINYSDFHSGLLNYNKQLQPKTEKQRNFRTIPNIPLLSEFQLQSYILATTYQHNRVSKEKASTVSKIFDGIKSMLPVLSLIRLLEFLFHQ